jgi:hypothetical protein
MSVPACAIVLAICGMALPWPLRRTPKSSCINRRYPRSTADALADHGVAPTVACASKDEWRERFRTVSARKAH